MKNKWLSMILSVSLVLLLLPLNAVAAETYTYSITPASSEQAIGSEFDVTIALTNYATTTANIRGLQIDVKGIDPNILEVVSHSTSITDATAASNKTSYSTSGKYVRLMYATMSGTLDKSTTEVFKMRLKINSSLTSDGTITLPVTLKIVSTDGNTTQNSSIVINYTAKTVSVDITWGAMEFTYMDGDWQPESHTYADGEWTADNENGNVITVTNNGNMAVNATLTYTKTVTEVEGSFIDNDGTAITSPFTLAVEEEKKVKLILTGKPSSTLEDATLGSVTVTITLPEAQDP